MGPEGTPLERAPEKERTPDSALISEIEVIAKSGLTPKTKEDLAELVEAPLLEACEELFEKNIRTVMSSANSKDVGGEAYIDIDYETLSEENKQIAMSLGELFDMHGPRTSRNAKPDTSSERDAPRMERGANPPRK